MRCGGGMRGFGGFGGFGLPLGAAEMDDGGADSVRE
jgi:hypothetical protein